MEPSKNEMMYRYCQLKRHFAWEIMKYLKSHPEVIAVNDNSVIYDQVREIQITYWMNQCAEKTREEAEEIVDLFCRLEINSGFKMMYFDQNALDLFRPGVTKDDAYYNELFFELICYSVESSILFNEHMNEVENGRTTGADF